jgi:predicted signal transduction protein with EAL and GGDEF domain
MTMSGGVVTATDGDDIQSLLAAADVALYQAKNSGRNRIEPQLPDARSGMTHQPGRRARQSQD